MNADVSLATACPRLAPGVRLHHDAAREQWVLLGPERVIELDETAYAILALCDGQRSLQAISKSLATDYQAPPAAIFNDVGALCAELADKRLLTL